VVLYFNKVVCIYTKSFMSISSRFFLILPWLYVERFHCLQFLDFPQVLQLFYLMDILVDQDNRMTLILWDMDDYPEKFMISTIEIKIVFHLVYVCILLLNSIEAFHGSSIKNSKPEDYQDASYPPHCLVVFSLHRSSRSIRSFQQ